MSSLVNPQPDPAAADELVAYLDGELPPPDCRRVEDRLATDEGYRQQLHELDRAWEALDALPANAVDDGFARTTIELACVAAEADLTEHTENAKATKRNRTRRWMAAGVAAVVIGYLAGRALIPNHNEALLADLPAIQQVNVLPYVEDVEFLRRLSSAVPAEQLAKDEPAFERNVTELERANSPLLEIRRDWLKSLQPEQKAELADRAREFDDLEHSSEEQQRMRQVMADIRTATDAPVLQKTLVAYGQWLSRHTAGQQEQLRQDLRDRPADERAALVGKLVRRDEEQSWRHLSADETKALRDEILALAADKKADFMQKMARSHRGERLRKLEENPKAQALVILWAELLDEKSFQQTADRLVGKLSPATQAHWQTLGRGMRDLRKPQLGVWVRDAMRPKLDPEELERFFASDELSNDDRQRLLEMQRPEMETELKRLYLSTGLGIDRGQLLREFGEPGRTPRNGPGPAGQPWRPEATRSEGLGPGESPVPGGLRSRQRFGGGRPPGPGGAPPERRPDDRPNKRRPPNRPQQSLPDHPAPPPDQKQQAI